MTTAIVASAAVSDAAELERLGDAARGHADWIEARVDRWRGSGEELAAALARPGLPAIVTARPRWEGGDFPGSESDRLARLRAAARTASHVDVELKAAFVSESFAPAKKVVSTHDFAATRGDLDEIVAQLRGAAADAALVKLAATPRSLSDVVRLARLQREQARGAPPLVAFGMGELGSPTRLLAGKLGAPIVYGSVAGFEPTAPGQRDVRELSDLFRVREQTAATAVAAVVGNPVAHSLGPLLHNTLYLRHVLDRVFVPLRAETLDEALAAADELGIDGLSVTLPFKQAAARAASGAIAGHPWPLPEGAVNTLKRAKSGWLAANTDRVGLLATLERGAPELLARGRTVLVVGAGGAARTVVAALVERGLLVTVASRTAARAVELARTLGAAAVGLASLDASRFDLVVNATPVGMEPDRDSSPLAGGAGALRAGQVMLDLVYRPRRTRLLEQAEAAGARPLDGFEFFLAQALAQFRIFTGRDGDAELARATVERALAPL